MLPWTSRANFVFKTKHICQKEVARIHGPRQGYPFWIGAPWTKSCTTLGQTTDQPVLCAGFVRPQYEGMSIHHAVLTTERTDCTFLMFDLLVAFGADKSKFSEAPPFFGGRGVLPFFSAPKWTAGGFAPARGGLAASAGGTSGLHSDHAPWHIAETPGAGHR